MWGLLPNASDWTEVQVPTVLLRLPPSNPPVLMVMIRALIAVLHQVAYFDRLAPRRG
jgi:hypothetical protein